MKTIFASFSSEYLKLRNSRIFWIILFIFTIIPFMIGLMMFVARNPDMAAKLGMVGTKAQLFGKNEWAGFFDTLNQSAAGVDLIGFGFVTSWIFGREYSERTLKDLLALPVSRTTIVIGKFLVTIVWCILLILVIYFAGIGAGWLIHIPDWSFPVFYRFSHKFFVSSLLTLVLVTPVGFFASYGKGLIAPLGFVILTLVLAQFLGLVGLGSYFPWAIPGLYITPAGTSGMELHLYSYIILFCTSLMGLIGTIAYWQKADQHI